MKRKTVPFALTLAAARAVGAPALADGPQAIGGWSMHSRGMGMGMMHGTAGMRGAMDWTPAARGWDWAGRHMGYLTRRPIALMREQKETLGLTPDQVSRLEALRSRFQDTATAKLPEIGMSESEFHAALTGGTTDASRAEAAVRAIAASQADLEVLWLRTISQAERILTAEEREKLRGLFAGAHCPGMGQSS